MAICIYMCLLNEIRFKSQKIKIKYFTDTKCIFRHHFMYKNLDKLSRVHLGKFFQETSKSSFGQENVYGKYI